MVAGGISLQPSLAVKAHAVQHSKEAIEYQNQAVLNVFDAAATILMRPWGTYFTSHGLLGSTECCPGTSALNEFGSG